MSELSDLRVQVFEWAEDTCEWPGCTSRAAELAHIHGKGMGGRAGADVIENLSALCKPYHDLLDGRSEAYRAYEVRVLYAAYLFKTRPYQSAV